MKRLQKRDPKVAVLRESFGLSGTRQRDLSALATLFDEVRIAPGERLVSEGEAGSELFLIVTGEAAVTSGGEMVATVGPGQLVGEVSLVDQGPRSATVTALTPMETLVAGAESFATLLTDAAVVRRLAVALAHRLRASQGSPIY